MRIRRIAVATSTSLAGCQLTVVQPAAVCAAISWLTAARVYSLFAVRCSLFAVRCSLFAVRCSRLAARVLVIVGDRHDDDLFGGQAVVVALSDPDGDPSQQDAGGVALVHSSGFALAA